ncbi:MAG: hypothetical protein Q4D52_02280 [Eubacteriales bacterium]|nr:hypothetical protein [Eubacteriales bacterium]
MKTADRRTLLKYLFGILFLLLMGNWLLPSATLTARAAGIPIDEVRLKGFSLPMYGEPFDFELEMDGDYHCHFATVEEIPYLESSENFSPVQWHFEDHYGNPMEHSVPGTICEPGAPSQYHMNLVIIPDAGYSFTSDVTLTVAELPNLVFRPYWAPYHTEYTFISELVEALEPIHSVEINSLRLPTAWQYPDMQIQLPEGAPYRLADIEEMIASGYGEMSAVHWEALEDEIPFFMDGEQPFDASFSTQYRGRVLLSPREGYGFASNVAVTINGSDELIDYVASSPFRCSTLTHWMLPNPAPGWLKSLGGWYYYLADSSPVTNCWKKINGFWHHFDPEGLMQIGWLKDNGKWYYLNCLGYMVTGWQKIDGHWFYFVSEGAMKTGWLKLEGKWYYLKPSGVMATGWQKIGHDFFYFDAYGVMVHDKWIGDYYLLSSGVMATNRWIGKYHVGADGKWDKTR